MIAPLRPHYTGDMASEDPLTEGMPTARGAARAARRVAVAALVVALLLIPRAPRVEAATALGGEVSGFEICPQELCGAAIFLGAFRGTLDGVDDPGGWWVVVNHEPLPRAGASAAIRGGRWGLRAGERRLPGSVASGTLRNNGDGTFTVTPVLVLSGGGEGALTLAITLDHRAFPPAVTGRLATSTGVEDSR